jgi:glycerate dehydrogenase
VLTNKTKLPKSVLDRLPELQYIGVLATGYDVVDVEAATVRGVPVTNIPSYGTDSVAQMVFAHILRHCHHVAEHASAVSRGDWARQPDFCFWNSPLVELTGSTIGIIGFGRIGRKVGELATAFGMQVIANDTNQANPPAWPGFRYEPVETLLREADVVSLNCPLTDANRGMINRKTLGFMKKSAFLVNCSRGALVEPTDLADALNEGSIAGAGLDVMPTEPPESDNPLLSAHNCSITPHIAWATRSARSRLLNTAVANVKAFVAGHPQNVVNQ